MLVIAQLYLSAFCRLFCVIIANKLLKFPNFAFKRGIELTFYIRIRPYLIRTLIVS